MYAPPRCDGDLGDLDVSRCGASANEIEADRQSGRRGKRYCCRRRLPRSTRRVEQTADRHVHYFGKHHKKCPQTMGPVVDPALPQATLIAGTDLLITSIIIHGLWKRRDRTGNGRNRRLVRRLAIASAEAQIPPSLL